MGMYYLQDAIKNCRQGNNNRKETYVYICDYNDSQVSYYGSVALKVQDGSSVLDRILRYRDTRFYSYNTGTADVRTTRLGYDSYP